MLTTKDVCERLEVSPQTVDMLVREKRLIPSLFGRERMFDDREVEEIVKRIRSHLPTATELANTLGIERSTFHYYLDKWDITPDAYNRRGNCYGSEKIKRLMKCEGWEHPGYEETPTGIMIVVFRGAFWRILEVKGMEVKEVKKSEKLLRVRTMRNKYEMAALLNISVRTLEGWIANGKLQFTGKLPLGEPVWTHRDAEEAIEMFNAYGWTMGDIASLYNISYSLANGLVARYNLNSVGLRDRAKVYDVDDVKAMMKGAGITLSNVRIMRVDGGVRPEDIGWFVVVINEEDRTLKVLSESLETLEDAEERAFQARLKVA